MPRLPRLDPAVAATRRAVRSALAGADERARGGPEPGRGSRSHEPPLLLVALSGGADSLALAAAAAFEAGAAGWRAGAIIVDHGLQAGSERVSVRAAEAARRLGLSPVLERRVEVGTAGGPEAAARDARYEAFRRAVRESGAEAVLTAHTRDDQAEQVLLALARGSGPRSLAGIPERRILDDEAVILRPFLSERGGVTRAATVAACAAQGLEPWADPHNADPRYARARVRERVLPVIERELGPGAAPGLARTADLLREDADALDEMAEALFERLVEHADAPGSGAAEEAANGAGARVALPLGPLETQVAALRNRLIRLVAERCFDSHLSREHTLAVAALVTDWRGQGPVFVPGIRVVRAGRRLVFARQTGSPRVA